MARRRLRRCPPATRRVPKPWQAQWRLCGFKRGPSGENLNAVRGMRLKASGVGKQKHTIPKSAITASSRPTISIEDCPDMAELTVYAGLFMTALVAATVFPFQSEAVLVGLILADTYSVTVLVAVASVGNVAGSCINWGIGRGTESLKNRKWFPVKPDQLERSSNWYRRYGKWSLLLSWAPFIGDPLTVAAGVLREPFWSFVLLVAIAKTGRYVVLAAATLHAI